MRHFQANTLLPFITALFLLPSLTHAADKLTADGLLDPNHIVEVKVTLAKDDWEILRRQTRDMSGGFSGGVESKVYTYFKADVSVDGVEIKSVGIRKKGFIGSQDSDRPSLKIKFGEFVKQSPVAGLDRLTLNNNKQDTSQVSQFLSYRVFRDAGLHASRSNFARVTVNGKYLGIYTHIESVKNDFLARSFGHDVSTPGNLYEGTIADFYISSVDQMEAKTNKKNKTRPRLVELANLISSDDDLDFAKLEKMIDIEDFMRFWAVESLIKHWDGYNANQNNYFIYFNPVDDRGYFMPWGTDSVWTGRGATCVFAQSMLSNRLYNTDGIPERYRQTMLRLLEEAWDEDALLQEIDRIEELVTPHLHDSQSSTAKSMDNIRDFIRDRREQVTKELKHWPARVPSGPRKPRYTVPLADVTGTFSTTWQSKDPKDPMKSGKVRLAWKLANADAMMVWRKMGVTTKAYKSSRRRKNKDQRIILTFTGQRLGDRDRTEVSLLVDRDEFEAASKKPDKPIDVAGAMLTGNALHFSRGPGKAGGGNSVKGKLYLTKSGTADGDAIEGRVDLKVLESRGGR